MDRIRAAVAHSIPDRSPMSVRSGEVVEVGDRSTGWPAFVFVTGTHGSGWVPSRHLSATVGRAIVETPYDTTELATSAGEVAVVPQRPWIRGMESDPNPGVTGRQGRASGARRHVGHLTTGSPAR